MRKILLALSFLLIFSLDSKTQTFWEENFESYNAGEYIGLQSTEWSTWSGTGAGTNEDLFVSTDQSNSGSNSLRCDGNADVIVPLNNIGEGEHTVEFSLYVVPGNAAYYNLQEDNIPAIGWAFECYFSNDGTWEMIQDLSQVASGTYSPGTWFRMSHVIDLVNNVITVYQDGAPVGNFVFDSAIGSINIFPTAPVGQTPFYYIDDIYVYKSKENFEDYIANEFLGNQSQQWKTWSGGGSGTSEDGSVSNLFSFNGINSGIMEGDDCDAIYPMGNFSAGSWELSLKLLTPTGSGAYFNLQHDETPGVSWAHELSMGGTEGNLLDGGVGASFSWSPDVWHALTLIYDIENNEAELWIDGESIHNWTFSNDSQSGGTGLPILGALNFHPSAGPVGLNPEFYIDNMTFRRTSLATSNQSIQNSLNEMNVFPNPSQDAAFIQNNTETDLKSEIRIFNGVGQLIDQQFEHFEAGEMLKINSNSWKSGIYFIEIIASDSRKTFRFIKN